MKTNNKIFSSVSFITFLYLLFSISKEVNTSNTEKGSLNSKINDIQYFIYYIPEKEIILCSDKIFSESEMNLIPNELKLDDKFTCMINLDDSYIYSRINLHILKIKRANFKKNLLDIFLGDTLAIENINILRTYTDKNDQSYIRIQFLLKFVDSKVLYMKKLTLCKIENIDACEFTETEDSLFRKKNLMINIKLKESNDKEISLLEKKSIKHLDNNKSL